MSLFFLGDLVMATLGNCKWQSYWKTKASNLQPCIADGKLDILYYGIPGLTSILGVQLHGKFHLLFKTSLRYKRYLYRDI